ncbi:MAG: hypothetical protein ACK56F_16630 [bacterium]
MTGAASAAEPAAVAPLAAATPPAARWQKRGKDSARHARANV